MWPFDPTSRVGRAQDASFDLWASPYRGLAWWLGEGSQGARDYLFGANPDPPLTDSLVERLPLATAEEVAAILDPPQAAPKPRMHWQRPPEPPDNAQPILSRSEMAAKRGAPMEQPVEPSAQLIAQMLRGAPMEQPKDMPLTEDVVAGVGGGGASSPPASSYAQIAMKRFGDAYPLIISRAMEEAEMRRRMLQARKYGMNPAMRNLQMLQVMGKGPQLFNRSPAGQEWARRQGGTGGPGLQPQAVPEGQNRDQELAALLQQFLTSGGRR